MREVNGTTGCSCAPCAGNTYLPNFDTGSRCLLGADPLIQPSPPSLPSSEHDGCRVFQKVCVQAVASTTGPAMHDVVLSQPWSCQLHFLEDCIFEAFHPMSERGVNTLGEFLARQTIRNLGFCDFVVQWSTHCRHVKEAGNFCLLNDYCLRQKKVDTYFCAQTTLCGTGHLHMLRPCRAGELQIARSIS